MPIEMTLNGTPVDHIEGFGQKVELDAETKTALLGYIEAHQNDDEYQAFVRGDDKARLDSMMTPDAPLSAAQQLLNELKAQCGPLIEAVTIRKREWHIKRLDWPAMVEVSTQVSKIAQAPSMALLPQRIINLRANAIGILAACVAENAEGGAFFDVAFDGRGEVAGTAFDFVAEPVATTLVNELFAHCTRVNPDILPTPKAAEVSDSS